MLSIEDIEGSSRGPDSPCRAKSRRTSRFPFHELDELAGFVATEANHAKDKKLQKELNHLFERIDNALESYTDQDD